MKKSEEKHTPDKNMPQQQKTFDQSRIWYSWVFSAHELTDGFILPEPVQIFVIQGNITLYIDDLSSQTVNSNEMLVLTSATHFRIESGGEAHVIICRIPVDVMFSDRKLVSELLSINVPKNTESNGIKIHKTIRKFLLLLICYLNDGLISEYLYDIKRQELFALLFAYYDKTVLACFFNKLISQDSTFKMFVFNNYRKAKNIKELAALSNYSTSGFIKKFQRNFNESPYHWMQKQKAKLILADISRGGKSLQMIAGEYNFSSYQHFSMFCHKNFNMPPTHILCKKLIRKYTFEKTR